MKLPQRLILFFCHYLQKCLEILPELVNKKARQIYVPAWPFVIL